MKNSKISLLFIYSLMIFCIFCGSAFCSDSDEPAEKNSFGMSNNDETVKNLPSTSEMFYKLLGMIVIVAVVGGGALYFSRKVLPKVQGQGKKIRVIETAHLGAKRGLHLVEVGGRKFLLASTNESVTNLADVTAALSDLSDVDLKEFEAKDDQSME